MELKTRFPMPIYTTERKNDDLNTKSNLGWISWERRQELANKKNKKRTIIKGGN